ncbi:MAG: cysteine hydrolase [Clostridiales Family XIII bacterium]|jgi:nicotinamidase-related amidase|nr:cysteine hydrolase [Clostridiales Family XIII bacterium]
MGNYLIVVDMQNDFVNGALGSAEAVAVVPAVVEKIWEFDGDVIFTYDTHGADYPNTQEGRKLPVAHCIEGTDGWRLFGELENLRFKVGGRAFTKETFGSRDLAAYLVIENEKKPVERIELVGLCTDICVISNAILLKSFLPEAEISVDAACCAGVTPESHARALGAMRACQIEITNGA